MGIISAEHRNVGGEEHSSIQNFLQTDAAINPGNSGGALINSKGHMIGMNTAILTSGSVMVGEGGNIGIGFAIPSNLVKEVTGQLVKSGKVSRGYIGVLLQSMNADLAKQFGLSNDHGALIVQVDPNTPGAKAGLKVGDVIVAIDGQEVHGVNDTILKVISHAPSSTTALDIVRNGKHIKVPATLTTRSNSANFGRGGFRQNNNQENHNQGNAEDGITAETLTPQIAQQLNLPAGTHGVVIDHVDQAAPAADVLSRGMVITQVNRHPINNLDEFRRYMSTVQGKPVLLTVLIQGTPQFVVIHPYKK